MRKLFNKKGQTGATEIIIASLFFSFIVGLFVRAEMMGDLEHPSIQPPTIDTVENPAPPHWEVE